MDPHRRAELRSIAYHRRIAELLETQPEILDRARETLRRHRRHPHYEQAWTALLSEPLATIQARLVADDEEGRAMRQTTPFAGALSQVERWRIFREFM